MLPIGYKIVQFCQIYTLSGIKYGIFNKMASLLPKFELMVKNSFLPQELQQEFLSLLKERISRIEK